MDYRHRSSHYWQKFNPDNRTSYEYQVEAIKQMQDFKYDYDIKYAKDESNYNYINEIQPIIQKFKDKFPVIWNAFQLFPGWMDFILKDVESSDLWNNEDFVFDIVGVDYVENNGNGRSMKYASERIKSDPTFVLAVLDSMPRLLKVYNPNILLDCISPKLINDIDFIKDALVITEGSALRYLPTMIRNDPELMKEFIDHGVKYDKNFPTYAIIYSTPEIKANEEVVLHAIDRGRIKSPVLDSLDLRGNKNFMLQAVQLDPYSIRCGTESIKNDREVVETAIGDSYGCIFNYASPQLQADKDIVIMAIRAGYPNEFTDQISPAFMDDKDIAIVALRYPNFFLVKFSDAIKNDIDVAMVAVKKSGLELQHVSPDLRNNKQLVLAAVQNDHRAIDFASDSCQHDAKIVLASELRKYRLASMSTLVDYEQQLPLYFERAKNSSFIIYQCLLKYNDKLPAVSGGLNAGM